MNSNKNTTKFILIIIVALLIISMIAISVVFLTRNNNSEEPKSQSPTTVDESPSVEKTQVTAEILQEYRELEEDLADNRRVWDSKYDQWRSFINKHEISPSACQEVNLASLAAGTIAADTVLDKITNDKLKDLVNDLDKLIKKYNFDDAYKEITATGIDYTDDDLSSRERRELNEIIAKHVDNTSLADSEYHQLLVEYRAIANESYPQLCVYDIS